VTTDAGSDGGFTFAELDGDYYAFDAAMEGDDSFATVLSFLQLGTGESKTLDMPVVVPSFTHEVTLDQAGDFTVADDLVITADPAGYTAPFGVADDAPVLVMGVAMDPVASGLPLDTINGEIVAMWYLGRWTTSVEPEWAFTATTDHSLAAGTELQILAADYYGLDWVDGGIATVQDDGSIASNDGSGIPVLSTLVLVQ
jgi:hypothetical protein